MSFLSKENRKIERRNLNSSEWYDFINMVLGLGIIAVAIVIFINKVKYEKLFAIEFMLASAMNLCMGVKYWKRHEIIKSIALFLAGIFFLVMTVISFIALWS